MAIIWLLLRSQSKFFWSEMEDRFVLDGATLLSGLLKLIFYSFDSFLAGELLSLGECISALIG